MLTAVPRWASALWGLAFVALIAAFLTLPGDAMDRGSRSASPAGGLIGIHFALSSSLVAWARWRRLTRHEDAPAGSTR
ncbi:hypothetical protein QEZ54_19290 [Catellatospora sp. KI3]|uniref:hypothetical protein n=1 Tax=Catellatospora sp. KI3 TaxID=3041620 RepID=UPI002482F83D|nr:hypothetical protein [Catellatospora sp. KI3]MDI1463127.1 hypothetical protein [Catellatospora sp. KI3]